MPTFKKTGRTINLKFSDLKVAADRQNSRDYFEDPPEIRDWKWDDSR